MTIDTINRLTMLWDKYDLPKEQTVWVEFEEYLKWAAFFKSLGSGNVFSVPLHQSNPELTCIMAILNGYHIHIVQY